MAGTMTGRARGGVLSKYGGRRRRPRQIRMLRMGTTTTGKKKIIIFGQKHFLTRDFYGSPPPPTSLDPDRWIRREGYDGPDLGEKGFQLFSIFIVWIYK